MIGKLSTRNPVFRKSVGTDLVFSAALLTRQFTLATRLFIVSVGVVYVTFGQG